MKKDIENKEDIKLLVDSFYEKVKADPVIGFIFTDFVKVNWERHLPVMYNFWENTLFFTGAYTGNPLDSHKRLHQALPLSASHFEQWNKLFADTVDALFEGPKANLAKQRALSISTVMKIKIVEQSEDASKVF